MEKIVAIKYLLGRSSRFSDEGAQKLINAIEHVVRTYNPGITYKDLDKLLD